MTNKVKTGLSVLKDELLAELSGRKVGVLCHNASVDENFNHIIDILADAGIYIEKIFAPEHGLFATEQDQEKVSVDVHSKYEIPIISLYGDNIQSLKPAQKELSNIDIIIIDLQDVGARYYTFVWTALLMLEAASQMGIEIWILDRPNPIGGNFIEGPIQEENFLSFVGLLPLPIRHGLTIGEILSYACELKNLPKPRIIAMQNWRRNMWFDETGLPWIMPSPNMPTLDTATVYPGMCLLEGTNLSEGRGTNRPFEIFGAPFIDSFKMCDALNSVGDVIPGVYFRPLYFTPTFNKFAYTRCGGAQIHILNRELFAPVMTAFAILRTVIRLYPDESRFKAPPYEYEVEKMPFDILTGSPKWRRMLLKNTPLKEFRVQFSKSIEKFEDMIKKFRLYG